MDEGQWQQDSQAKQAERAKAAQRIVNAYHRIFLSADGRTVLADLATVFGTSKPAFLAGPSGSYDGIKAAIRDGQRSVILHIEHVLCLSAKGDNEVESEPKVLK